jgi:hypothetical protein
MHSLLSDLERAFSNTALPPSTPLVQSTYDDEGVAEYFCGKSWQALSATQLRSMEFGPNIFSAEAFAHFTPAYIRAYLVDPVALDSVVESFVSNLGSPSDPKYPQYDRARAIKAILNAEQRAVVRRFLLFYAKQEGSCATHIFSETLHLYGGAQGGV